MHALEQCGYLANRARVSPREGAGVHCTNGRDFSSIESSEVGEKHVSDRLKHWYDQIQNRLIPAPTIPTPLLLRRNLP